VAVGLGLAVLNAVGVGSLVRVGLASARGSSVNSFDWLGISVTGGGVAAAAVGISSTGALSGSLASGWLSGA
jgi:hypothetical protein